jgi:hypothetical protein
VILDLLASGALSLSAVRMLRPHLTPENHESVLGRARNARRTDIEKLVAELAPRPDVPSSVRKLALPKTLRLPPTRERLTSPPELGRTSPSELAVAVAGSSKGVIITHTESDRIGIDAARGCPSDVDPERRFLPHVDAASTGPTAMDLVRLGEPRVARPMVQPLSPERYRVQFTIGQDAHDTLRQLQTLLRREIADGDPGVIFERALRLLYAEVEAARFGRAPKGRRRVGGRRDHAPMQGAADVYQDRIRPGADPTSFVTSSPTQAMDPVLVESAAGAPSRYIPKAVKRAVWFRDRGQCAFVSVSGRPCVEREFLELHHIRPWALKGPATAANITLRCRRHNAYESEAVFGARAMVHYRQSDRPAPPG